MRHARVGFGLGAIIALVAGALMAVSVPAASAVTTGITEVLNFGPSGHFPTSVLASRTNSVAYVASSESDVINSINTAANPPSIRDHALNFAPEGVTLNFPYGLALSPDDGTLFTSNYHATSAASIEDPSAGGAHARTYSLPGCNHPAGISMDSAGNELFVACAGSQTVKAVDPISGVVDATVRIPALCELFGGATRSVPSGVSADGVPDSVVVADANCNDVWSVQFVEAGTLHSLTATPAFGPGFLSNPAVIPASANWAFSTWGCQYRTGPLDETVIDGCLYLAQPALNQIARFTVERIGVNGTEEAHLFPAGDILTGPNCLRPFGVAADVGDGATLGVSCAGLFNVVPSVPAVARLYTLHNNPQDLNPPPLPTTLSTVDLPAGQVPSGIAVVPPEGANPTLAYVADQNGNQVFVIDPPAGQQSVAGLRSSPSLDRATAAAAALEVAQLHPLSP